MIQSNFSLIHYNTFGINVNAHKFVEYSSEDELYNLILNGEIKEPYLHIGEGSNILFTKDYAGTILHSRIGHIELLKDEVEDVYLKVGAGINWDHFVAYCVNRNWYGIENLSLIPGEVGASAVQNIGAYGVEVKDVIVSVDTMNIYGERKNYLNSECGYSYRNSIFKKPEMKNVFVTYVTFKLSKIRKFNLEYSAIRDNLDGFDELTLSTVRSAIINIREQKLPNPKELGNAGSFFMNPIISMAHYREISAMYADVPSYKISEDQIKIPAAWLIDKCGWKGKSMGAAAVYDKQALVLVNKGGATGADIMALSAAIQASVFDKFKIKIHPEVNII